ncbi:hypothetical protein X947_6108 [Burkholderia pseudomallei MSHR7334]|nr:hypothetical protein X947_6108 [Burkholderia pseudomallei MSHR7334]
MPSDLDDGLVPPSGRLPPPLDGRMSNFASMVLSAVLVLSLTLPLGVALDPTGKVREGVKTGGAWRYGSAGFAGLKASPPSIGINPRADVHRAPWAGDRDSTVWRCQAACCAFVGRPRGRRAAGGSGSRLALIQARTSLSHQHSRRLLGILKGRGIRWRYLAFVAQVRMVVGALPISRESSSMNKTRTGASPWTGNGADMTPHTGSKAR